MTNSTTPAISMVDCTFNLDPLHVAQQHAADLAQRCEKLMFDALGEPRTRYVRVTLNGSHCVMHPSEGDCYVQDARDAGDPGWDRYVVRDVWLSEREFDALGEFDGF